MTKAKPVTDDEFIDELAEVFSDLDEARALLDRSRFPHGQIPASGTPMAFWTQVVRKVSYGVSAGGMRALAEAAAKVYPHNDVFGRYTGVSDEGNRSQEFVPASSSLEWDQYTPTPGSPAGRQRSAYARRGDQRYHGLLAPGSMRRHLVVRDRCLLLDKDSGGALWGLSSRLFAGDEADLDAARQVQDRAACTFDGFGGQRNRLDARIDDQNFVGGEGDGNDRLARFNLRVGVARRRRCLNWTELMKRVVTLDALTCSVCRGLVKMIAEVVKPRINRWFFGNDGPQDGS
jgi:hypothetical protein